MTDEPFVDELLEEVYAQRDAYAAEHDYNLDRILADLKLREAERTMRRLPASE